MKLSLITTIIPLIVISILPAVLSLAIRYTADFDQPSLNRAQKVYNGVSLSQTFFPSSNYLNGIGLSIKNPNLTNKKDLHIFIYDENNNLLGNTTRNGSIIADGNFVKLFFNPIPTSLGKKFMLIFKAEDATEKEALEIFLTDSKPSWTGDLFINSQKTDEKVSMVSFYSPQNPLAVMFKIYGGWLTRIAADPLFASSYILLIILGVGYLVFDLGKRKQNF